MSPIQRVVKPTTRKGKKVLQAKAPQIIEGPKQALLLQGRKTSETVRKTLKDLYSLKKPDAKLLSRKHDITIFENAAPVEQLCRRSETPVFIMGSHSKKRPDNLVLGRMFNYSLLDMIELGIDSLEALRDFSGPKITLGTKPCLIFNGPIWDQQEEYKHLKSIFIDLFHKEYVETIRLQGFEHALSFTASQDGKILLRSYKVILKKSGCKTPRIELEEIGPRLDFTLRRSKLPSEDLMKQACRKPKELKVTKKKNISTDGLGTTHGRIHVGKQGVSNLQTRKMKGLKKTPEERKAEKSKKRSFIVSTDIEPVKRAKVE